MKQAKHNENMVSEKGIPWRANPSSASTTIGLVVLTMSISVVEVIDSFEVRSFSTLSNFVSVVTIDVTSDEFFSVESSDILAVKKLYHTFMQIIIDRK